MNTSLHLFDLRILQLLNLVWYLPKFWSEMSLQFQRIWCQHRPYLSSGNSSKTSNVFSDILRLSPFERWDIWILGLVEDWPLWSEMSPQFWRISISFTLPLTLQRHLMFSLTYYGPLPFWKVGGHAGSNSLIFPWLPVVNKKLDEKTSQ